MATTERCPVCNASVKAENLLRHIEQNHPRHPDAQDALRQLRAESRLKPAPRPRSGGFRPSATTIAIVCIVVLLVVVAAVVAPYFDPWRNFSRDSCIGHENVPYHIHPWLLITIDGSPQFIPDDVGHFPGCLKPLHTHQGVGETGSLGRKIHVETPIPWQLTLGDFFAIWGRTVTQSEVLGCFASGGNVITMTVDRFPSPAFGSLVLADLQEIHIDCSAGA